MTIVETTNRRSVGEIYRLSTFLHLPPALRGGNAVALASDGLYYAADWHVQCFSCGVMTDLRQADSSYHARDCRFVNGRECGNIPLDRYANVPPRGDTLDRSM